MTQRRRYAILGTGALGGLYGGLLAKCGFEVHFLAHRDAEHIAQNGLKVETPLGDFHLQDVHVHADAGTMPACDVTIVALKSTQNHLLQTMLPHPTRSGGVVLVLQNGLDVEMDSVSVVGSDRVLGGCCFLCSNKVGFGHVRHLDYGAIVFGEYRDNAYGQAVPGITERALQVEADLREAGIDATATEDLLMTRWKKLMWNIPFNGLSVVLNASTKELIENPDSLRLVEQVIREVHGAACALGVAVPKEWIQKQVEATRQMVPYDASMRLDYKFGRPMELGAIFGNPLKAGARIGFEMPSVLMLFQQLQFMDAMQSKTQAANG